MHTDPYGRKLSFYSVQPLGHKGTSKLGENPNLSSGTEPCSSRLYDHADSV